MRTEEGCVGGALARAPRYSDRLQSPAPQNRARSERDIQSNVPPGPRCGTRNGKVAASRWRAGGVQQLLFLRPRIARFLHKLLRHCALKADEQQAVLGLPVRPSQARANADIVRVGETVDHVCLVVHGLIGRFEQTREGQRQITSLHLPNWRLDALRPRGAPRRAARGPAAHHPRRDR